MSPALQAISVALLACWPVYNVAMAVFAMRPMRVPVPRDAQHSREYWIMIPALNEARVIGNTVAAALALGTPEIPVRVLVVDDGSDDETPQILGRIRDRHLTVLRRELPAARQGKGEALNAGYRAIRATAERSGTLRSTVVGIIDGDGRPDATLLAVIDAIFAHRGTGAVQCRVRIHNRDRILGLLQDIEFGCIANAAQSLRDRLSCVGMGGNGQFTRLSELTRLGDSPWTGCLVEDMELGLRLHLAGVRIRYCSAATISQQAVVDPRPLLRQRARWAQGNLQCARHLPGLAASRHIGTAGLFDLVFYLVSPWAAVPISLLVLGVAALSGYGLVTGQTYGGLLAAEARSLAVAFWIAAILLPGLVWGLSYWFWLRAERLHRCLLAGFGYPVFLLLGVLATWRGAARHVLRRNSWAKTDRLAEEACVPPVSLFKPAPVQIVAPRPAEPAGSAVRAGIGGPGPMPAPRAERGEEPATA